MEGRLKSLIEKECREISGYKKDNREKNHSYHRGKLKGKDEYKYPFNLFDGLYTKKGSIKFYSIILFLIISFSTSSQILASKKFETRDLATNNYIILTIAKRGNRRIINETFTSLIASIQINDDEEMNETINIIQNLNSDINTIKITLKSPLTSCKDMFKNLQDIISIDLTNFDFSSVKYMESFFEECSSLRSVDFGDNSALNALNMSNMFKNCKSLVSVNLNNFKVRKIENLGQMFFGCENITSIDLSSLDTPDLTNMEEMFAYCVSLSYLNLSNFNTEKVKSMRRLFYNCSSLISLDLSSFKTPSLQSMHSMFFYCVQLISLNISNFDTTLVTNMEHLFDQCNIIKSLNISHFNTSSVTTIYHLFYKCIDLEFLDISNFNTDKITNMEKIFFLCQSLKSLNLKSFNTSSVESMELMFYGCNNLTSVDLSSFNTKSVKNMNAMFRECYELKSLDLRHFYTPKLVNMSEMFANCYSLEYLDISNFDTSKITNMSLLFINLYSLSSLNVQSFDTSSVKDMDRMFQGCYNLTSLNLSNFKTESVTNMKQMFEQCQSLTSLDISNFHTPLLTNIYRMFYNCSSLNYLDVSSLNTEKIQNFEFMFYNCANLTYLNVSNFITFSAVKMRGMFSFCRKLEYLDLKNFYTPSLLIADIFLNACNALKWVDISNFNISKVTNISKFFSDCHALTSLDIKNFDTKSVINMEYLFDNCLNLKSINLSHFDTSNVVSTYHMFHQCRSLTSLDLSNFNTTLIANMGKMFYRCDSLKYLDVNNFNTQKINNMSELFSLTNSLLFLNLSNFNIYDETLVENILYESNPNLTLCYNESKMPNNFLVQARRYKNNCKQLCIMNNKKYFFDIEMCVENCFDEIVYKFEYQDICYINCPIRTQLKANSSYLCEDCPYYYNYEATECIEEIPEGYYQNSTSDKTIDKCPSKCDTCSLQSINHDLCEECNTSDNYYPKYNDESNIETYIQCYHTSEMQIEYYLDNINKIYKPCYYKCKKCSGEGNDDNNLCEECKDGYIYDNGNCHLRTIENHSIISTNIISTIFEYNNKEYKYSYEISSISEEKKHNKTRVYMDVDPDNASYIKQQFSLSDEEKLFINITEINNTNPKLATTNYIYDFTLENKTILNISSIEEDIYIDTYVPIENLVLAKFNLFKDFAEQGYDIYDINSDFYTDFCTPASINGNDVSLEDRIIDIYPHNVTLCKSNCKYSGVNIEEQRVICSCNLNSNKNVNTDNEIVEGNYEHFITYLIDRINYKLFMCYKLFFNTNNLKKSYALYIILIIYFIISFFNFVYIHHTLEKLKIYMTKKMFENNLIFLRKNSDSKKLNPTINNANPNKRKTSKKANSKNISKKDKEKSKNSLKKGNNNFITIVKQEKSFDEAEKYDFVNIQNKNLKNYKKIPYKDGSIVYFQDLKEVTGGEEEDNINELPYSKAIRIDKRNIFCIFFSIITDKLELINILCLEHKIKIILLEEFILSLLINFFLNALLYTDDVVSNKYHNNGKLEFIVTLILSIISNIITSIFYYYKYSRGIEERVKNITEIKRKYHFYRNMKKLFLSLKIKFVLFFVMQIITILTCIYYLVIFGVKYPCSQISLVLNYCHSLVESIIISFGVSIIISITRKIGLSCSNKRLYNTSKYIDSKF